MGAFEDILNVVIGVFSTEDMIQLGVLLAVMLLAGLFMPNIGSIVTTTFVALVLFALAMFVRGVVLDGQDAATLAEMDWQNFLALEVKVLFAYAVAFAVVISVVFFVRSLVSR